jgi:hypothetical protein
MTEVSVARCTANFNSNHAMASIPMFVYILAIDRLPEAWPSRSGIKFMRRLKKRFPTTDAMIYAVGFKRVVLPGKWSFSAVFPDILNIAQPLVADAIDHLFLLFSLSFLSF